MSLKVKQSYDEFKRWDSVEQRRLLADHIPERNRRKRELHDACEGKHFFRKATGYMAVKLGTMQCLYCGFRTHNAEIIARGITSSNQQRLAEYKAFQMWNSAEVRKILEFHIEERKRRLEAIYELCAAETGHSFTESFNPKKRRKEYVCRTCTCMSLVKPEHRDRLANFRAQLAEKKSC